MIIQGCTTEGDLLFAQKVRESRGKSTILEWLSTQTVSKDPMKRVLVPRFGGGEEQYCRGNSQSSHSLCPVFLQCKELQGFIRPLTDLLNGLKMGRFERGNYLISCNYLARFISFSFSQCFKCVFLLNLHSLHFYFSASVI